MELTTTCINIAACQSAGHAPQDIITRTGVTERWRVASTPMLLPSPVRWTEVKDGSMIHIPVFAYQTLSRECYDAMAFATQLGVIAVADSGIVKPVRLHLVFGDLVEDLGPVGKDAFRYYFGLAFRIA